MNEIMIRFLKFYLNGIKIAGKQKTAKQEDFIMLKNFKKIDTKHTGLFAAGVLFGTAGIKILASEDARKLYANCTAAVLRAKECVMKTATNIQEHAEDIYAEAQQINEDRAAKEAVIDDESDFVEDTEEAAEAEDAE